MSTKKPQYDAIRRALMDWFETSPRSLPWRGERQPYQTWISEVMLQQTRVDQVLPYLERFMRRFPDVDTLARADIDSVLEVWEGLGYYARARNLHASASIVAEQGFPESSDGWRELPGVGEYTSAAVASILHGEPIAAIDGNVNRVVARLFAVPETYGSAGFRRAVRDYASRLLDTARPGAFNEAMMDLGATVCTPRTPGCTSCALSPECEAFGRDMAEAYPIRKPKKRPPLVHEVAAIVIRDGTELLIRRRPAKGLLGGLWELPGIRIDNLPGSPTAALSTHLRDTAGLVLELGRPLDAVRHAYSHFKVSLVGYPAVPVDGRTPPELPDDWRWLRLDESATVGMPRLHRRVLEAFASMLR